MKNNENPDQPPKTPMIVPYLAAEGPNAHVPIEPTMAAVECAAAHSIQTCEHFHGKPRFLIFSPLAWQLATALYQQTAAPGMPQLPTHYAGIPVALNKQFPGIIVVAIG